MNFLNGSFRIGQLFGINIRVHVLFVVYVGYILLTSGSHWRSEALFWGMLFGIVLVHEFGHCFGARSVGGDAENILMWPARRGWRTHTHRCGRGRSLSRSPLGPLVNVLFCLISAVVVFVATGGNCEIPISPFGSFALPTDAWNNPIVFGSGPSSTVSICSCWRSTCCRFIRLMAGSCFTRLSGRLLACSGRR